MKTGALCLAVALACGIGSVLAAEKGEAFSPVQVRVKHKGRYLIVQALPGALTTVVVR